jgi:3-hydroxymyristoyl/3-hydroxydecanoyl-(acyl carrier protein) dehydratase
VSGPVDLIPHQPPFRLIDRVVERGADFVRAEKRLTAGDPLLVADGLAETLVVEALAQTAAALNTGEMGEHHGLLVQARGFSFEGRPATGTTLTLIVRRAGSLGALHRFAAEASVDGTVVARGELTFAVSELS